MGTKWVIAAMLLKGDPRPQALCCPLCPDYQEMNRLLCQAFSDILSAAALKQQGWLVVGYEPKQPFPQTAETTNKCMSVNKHSPFRL